MGFENEKNVAFSPFLKKKSKWIKINDYFNGTRDDWVAFFQKL